MTTETRLIHVDHNQMTILPFKIVYTNIVGMGVAQAHLDLTNSNIDICDVIGKGCLTDSDLQRYSLASDPFKGSNQKRCLLKTFLLLFQVLFVCVFV